MNKQSVGRKNFYDGLAAEAGVERRYCDSGGKVVARRWRGAAGEVDLIIRKGAELIFVEVKRPEISRVQPKACRCGSWRVLPARRRNLWALNHRGR